MRADDEAGLIENGSSEEELAALRERHDARGHICGGGEKFGLTRGLVLQLLYLSEMQADARGEGVRPRLMLHEPLES